MDRLSRGSSSTSSSNRIRKSVISEEYLKNWKLPASSASDIYNKRTGIFSTVRTVEKEIRLSESYASFPLFSIKFQRFYKKCFALLHVGMIQVALKPSKLGSNTTAVICLRDNRLVKYEDSILKKVESNLRDGPIYFSYFPTHFIATCDANDTFTIDLLTQESSNTMRRDESVVLMFRFHYKLVKSDNVLLDMKYLSVSKSLADAAQRNSPSSGGGEDAGANARVDWRETAEAHVLKVDVPGLKKEEVRVEVEDDGCTLKISGERSNEQEKEKGDMWHCVERSSGKFLRRVTLPENAKLEEVKAAMENGVLTVTVPEEKLKKKTQVKVIEITG